MRAKRLSVWVIATGLVTLAMLLAAVAPAGAIRFFSFHNRYAGFELPSSDPFRTTMVDFTVPTISCPASSAQIVLAGATVFSGSVSRGSGGGIELFCVNGAPTYVAVLDAAPNQSQQVYADIQPCDRVSVQVTSALDSSRVDVTDVRTHDHWSLSGDDVGTSVSTAIGVFGQVCSKEGSYAVPTFDTIRFQNIHVDSSGGFVNARRHQLRDSTDTITVRASELHAGARRFTDRFEASGSSGPC